MKDKLLVMPGMKGSTVGAYTLFALRENNVAPKAVITVRLDPILVAGCVLANISLARLEDKKALSELRSGSRAQLRRGALVVGYP